MQDLRVTLVQANQVWEDKQANFNNYNKLLSDLSNTDLIILPEMFHTGFTMNAKEFSETMENSIGLNWLKDISRQKDAAIYTSLIIEESNHFYNRGVFVFPTGEIHYYDKRKRFALAGEDEVFFAGNERKIVQYKNWKIQLQICYDLRFPEITRNSLDENGDPLYDVLIYVSNWPEKRSVHWNSLLPARAIENQCYVIVVNRVGDDGKTFTYSGESVLIDMLGNKDYLNSNKEEIKSFNLNKLELNSSRNDLPFLKDI